MFCCSRSSFARNPQGHAWSGRSIRNRCTPSSGAEAIDARRCRNHSNRMAIHWGVNPRQWRCGSSAVLSLDASPHTLLALDPATLAGTSNMPYQPTPVISGRPMAARVERTSSLLVQGRHQSGAGCLRRLAGFPHELNIPTLAVSLDVSLSRRVNRNDPPIRAKMRHCPYRFPGSPNHFPR